MTANVRRAIGYLELALAVVFTIIWACMAAGCVTTPVPTHPPQPPPTITHTVQVQVTPDGVLEAVSLIRLTADPPFERLLNPCQVDGVALTCTLDPAITPPYGGHLWISAPGYVDQVLDVRLEDVPLLRLAPIELQPVHVDPSNIPLGELARIRGAMWPRASVCPQAPSLPFGPRPGSPDNIIATAYFDNYSADQQAAIFDCLRAAGYTHVVTGGIVDAWAYHGLWQGHDYSSDEGFERWLDIHQAFWDHGFTPVTFIHVDGETYEQTEARMVGLVARHPRAQRLMRILIMSGWEPTRYDWSSCTWAKYVALGRRLFPNALQGVHTVTDVDAPVGTDSLCDDNGQPNGQGWQRLASAGVHLWFIQNGPYGTSPAADPTLARNFAAQFQPNGPGADAHGVAWHFWNRIDSWPNWSGFGPGIPICPVAAEHTAYEATWNNRPGEAGRNAWGDLAVTAPGSDACGYLDGGTVDVPRRR